MIKFKETYEEKRILTSSIDQIISRLKEKKIGVTKVLSRTELRKRLTQPIENGNKIKTWEEFVMSQVTLNVQGMSCGHCVNSIEGNVGKLNGVESVNVNLDEEKVDITFDPSAVTLRDITDLIEDQGYAVGEKASQGKSCHCC